MKIIQKLGLIVILAVTTCLSGCWDSKTTEALNIPIAAGYELVEDKQTNEKQMQIYAVIPVFFENAPEKYIVDITEGAFVGETRIMRHDHLGEKLSLGNFQVAVLGKTLASEGARDVLNVLLRTPEMKKTVKLAVAEDDINDIFEVEPENYPNVGIYLNSLMDEGLRQSIFPQSTVHTFMVSMDTPGWHPIAPILKAEENIIYISGYAIFNKDKLAHTITLPEALILNFLRNRTCNGIWSYSFKYKENIPISASVEVQNKSRIKVSRSDKGYCFDVDIKSSGSIVEIIPNDNYKTLDSKLLKEENLLKSKDFLSSIEKGLENYIIEQSTALIQKAQQDYGMDIFNWVKFAQAKWRSELEDADWDKIFSQSEVSVNAKVDIEYIGEQT